ncbi:uncharacterized protein LOC126416963 [Schistocerca serialis cubense]|uniref:uncharacterized protein LOC126416963 n=1 Tax=Schistocerca serialis cubense TaxID=2023355 RepID=UPI00214E0204|nr:uncharacterized protein LOC126416963 [Schistocerca serialis cubense]
MGRFRYGRRNVEGEEILNLCIKNRLLVKNTFFEKHDSHEITRHGWDGKSRTVTDYILTDKLIGGKVKDSKVIQSEYLDSNHRLLVADLNCKIKSLNAVQRIPKIEERKMKEEENKKSFQNLVAQKLPKTERDSEEEEWILFKTSIVNSALQICGKTKSKMRDKQTSWWDSRVKDANKYRNMARKNMEFEKRNHNQVLVPKDEHKVKTLEKDYQRKKLQAKRIVKEEKEKSWEIFIQELDQESKGNQELLYRLMKSKTSDREDIQAIEIEDGDIIRDMEDIREEMKNYSEILLNGEVHKKVTPKSLN